MARVGLGALAGAAVLALGAAAVVWLVLRDRATPASVEDAVTSFRDST